MKMWEAAQLRIGIPWMEGGKTDQGIDCYGMVVGSAKDAGFDLDPRNQFSRRSPPQKLAIQLQKTASLVPFTIRDKEGNLKRAYQMSDLAYGDIVVYQPWNSSVNNVHLGVLTPSIWPTGGEPFNAIYVPFRLKCEEVPLRQESLKFRWVFRLPDQEQTIYGLR